MSWLETSIMAKKGVAHGKAGAEYTITEAEQGTYHYVYGPYVPARADGGSRRRYFVRDA